MWILEISKGLFVSKEYVKWEEKFYLNLLSHLLRTTQKVIPTNSRNKDELYEQEIEIERYEKDECDCWYYLLDCVLMNIFMIIMTLPIFLWKKLESLASGNNIIKASANK